MTILCIGGRAHGTWVLNIGEEYLHPVIGGGTDRYRRVMMHEPYPNDPPYGPDHRFVYVIFSMSDLAALGRLKDMLFALWLKGESLEPEI